MMWLKTDSIRPEIGKPILIIQPHGDFVMPSKLISYSSARVNRENELGFPYWLTEEKFEWENYGSYKFVNGELYDPRPLGGFTHFLHVEHWMEMPLTPLQERKRKSIMHE